MDDDPNQPFFVMLTSVVAVFVMLFGAVALYLMFSFIEYVTVLLALATIYVASWIIALILITWFIDKFGKTIK